jgi:hypothetical protein
MQATGLEALNKFGREAHAPILQLFSDPDEGVSKMAKQILDDLVKKSGAA